MPSLSRPPGPKGNRLLGHVTELRRDLLGFWLRCAREYGDVVHLRFLHQHHYMVSDPAHIEQVLITQSHNFVKWRPFRVLRPLFGDGLALSEGEVWRRQRRLAQPAFHRARIERYGESMVGQAEKRIHSWRDGEVRSVHEEMMVLTLGVTCETLFGTDISGDAREALDQLAALHKRFEDWITRGLPLPWTVPTPANLRMKARIRRLDAILYKIIHQRRARAETNGGDDLLSMLLQARDESGQAMSDRQLRDEVMTLFIAGYETTALTLSWAWYLMARHPEVRVRFLAELHDVLDGRPATVADLPKLRYTESVIHETLRLYPPVYSQGREALAECQIGEWVVPPGTQVFMSQWVVHRDPRWFDDPDSFRPERWLGGLTGRLPRCAYFPFGGGPRVCMGATFAMMEATLVLATIGRRFQLDLTPGQSVVPRAAATLQPVGGLPMALRSLS